MADQHTAIHPTVHTRQRIGGCAFTLLPFTTTNTRTQPPTPTPTHPHTPYPPPPRLLLHGAHPP